MNSVSISFNLNKPSIIVLVSSPELIILQLNRILKNKKGTGSTDRNKMITIAEKIFKETSSLLSLKYQEIQNLIQGRRNVLWNKNDSLSGLYLDEDNKY